MKPDSTVMDILAKQKEFTAAATNMLMFAQLEMENTRPDWDKVFQNVYLAMGLIETIRIVGASLDRMRGNPDAGVVHHG